MSLTRVRKFLVAEYHAGPLFMGWWVFVRDRPDGSPNDDGWNPWGWMRSTDPWSDQYAAWELCRALGHGDAPPPARYANDFARWFGGEFPRGIWVEIDLDSSRRRVGPFRIAVDVPVPVPVPVDGGEKNVVES